MTEKTVADSMRCQRLVARRIERRNGLPLQDRTAQKFPGLVRQNVTSERPNATWVGDITEIPTEHDTLYLATVIDLYSRRLLGAATGLHPGGIGELELGRPNDGLATRYRAWLNAT